MPAMDSIKDDFPALCEPITAIIGSSISSEILQKLVSSSSRVSYDCSIPGIAQTNYSIKQSTSTFTVSIIE